MFLGLEEIAGLPGAFEAKLLEAKEMKAWCRNLWTELELSLKGQSHCHKFGYDMRRVNNSPRIVGKSRRDVAACRLLSYIVTVSRILLWSAYKIFKRCKNLASTRHPKWMELYSYWSYSQLTRTMLYSCHIHCRLLSCSRRPKQLLSHSRFTTGQIWLAAIWYDHHAEIMTDSLWHLCEYFRQLYDNVRVFFEFRQDHKNRINGRGNIIKHSLSLAIHFRINNLVHFLWLYISL